MGLGKQKNGHGLLAIHAVGIAACTVIAGGALYFAGSSISNRRGVFLNARHELANTKGLLNDSLSERSVIELQVVKLEAAAENQSALLPVKTLNARTVEIVALAERAHISIDSLQPGDLITDQHVPVLPLSLSGQANAEHVFQFFDLLGKHMSDIHIQRVDMESKDMDSPLVNISLVLYWFVDPAGIDE